MPWLRVGPLNEGWIVLTVGRRHLAALSVVLAVVVGGCTGAPGSSSSPSSSGPAFPVTVQNCGQAVTVTQQPTRAVALNQGSIEQALALGLQGQMVGTAYLDDKVDSRWASAYAAVPVLSDKYPTKEVLAAAKPDLVMASYASAFADKAVGTRDQLQAQGAATYLDPFACPNQADRPAATFDAVWASLTGIATLFGRPQAAQSVVAAQRTSLQSVQSAKAGSGLKVFWWDSETASPYAGGNTGGPAMIMQAVGATNVFASLNKNWDNVSWEQVVAANPDVIVLADASWSTAQSKIDYIQADPTLSQLAAVKAKRFVTIPFSQSTPGATLIDGAVSVSKQLQALPK